MRFCIYGNLILMCVQFLARSIRAASRGNQCGRFFILQVVISSRQVDVPHWPNTYFTGSRNRRLCQAYGVAEDMRAVLLCFTIHHCGICYSEDLVELHVNAYLCCCPESPLDMLTSLCVRLHTRLSTKIDSVHYINTLYICMHGTDSLDWIAHSRGIQF